VQAVGAVFQKNFPEFLVLELGVSKKGDMKYLLSVVRPEVSVITNITQRYIESFSGMDSLSVEYKYLSKKTKKNGLLVINRDSSRSKEIAKKALAKVSFYGKNQECQSRIGSIERGSAGEVVEIETSGKMKRETLDRFGEHHAYARAATILVDEYIEMKKRCK
jgi:UDP-N-acetylmuramyl pentapeptide synthase